MPIYFKSLICLHAIFWGCTISVWSQYSSSQKQKNYKVAKSIATTDTVNKATVKSVYNPAIDRNRLMLLDAILELNEALIAGVKASMDSLLRPLPPNTNSSDKRMQWLFEKRKREKEEMLPYLVHIRDSLHDNSIEIMEERKAIQLRLDPSLALSENQGNRKTASAIEEQKSKPQQISKIEFESIVKEEETTPTPNVSKIEVKPNKKSETEKPGKFFGPTTDLYKAKPMWEPARAIIDTAALSQYEAQELSQPVPVERRRPAEDDTITHIKSDFFLRRAQKAVSDAQYKRAGDLLKKSLELWPRNYAALTTLGDLEVQNGFYSAAIKAYSRALNIDSTRASLSHKIGLSFLKLKKKNESLKNLSRAIRLDPFYIPAYLERARIYSSNHKYAEAVLDYNSALAVHLNQHPVYKERGIALLMSKSYASATDDFTRYLIFDQSDASVYYYRGLAKIGNNDWLEGCLDLSVAADMGYAAARKVMKKNCE